ncbi:elongation factor P hydroxylase [Colwellia ponticola]|uniref:Elongation factor P hydroxylase n=1 Tax=Colwellia ponticola TaxID=2304625 RepID=A0A8H2PLL1_9GAMM|nr:elongation factor P hydroxylase [Colwellia ponticola]TMM42481.1 elongation factor P hydroxylase [Colwellia ponticola]
MQHNYQDLIALFEQVFFQQYNTKLVRGDDEPLYAPADANCAHHQIIFAHGYYESALHEIAHWCYAGAQRRLLEDFGYWYIPDGRNEKQQQKFEQVEVIPQAIEWAFNVAVQKQFNTSADNLNGYLGDTNGFKVKVHQQVLAFIETGFPPRAQQFIDALIHFYQSSSPLTAEQFSVDVQRHNKANKSFDLTEKEYLHEVF